MKKSLGFLVAATILICAAGYVLVQMGFPPEKPEGRPKLVLAFYYPWYGIPSGPTGEWWHWPTGITNHPLDGKYDSKDPSVIASHLELAENVGIDGFIVSWWGLGSPTDKVFQIILDVAEVKKTSLRLTIYYEKVPPDGKAGVIAELKAILDNYGRRKAFLRVRGRPVIFIYGRAIRELSASDWAEVFENLRGDRLDAIFMADWFSGLDTTPFDGVHMYNPINPLITRFPPSELKNLLLALNYGFMRDNLIFAATVMPGYDDTRIRDPGFVYPRYDGKTYDAMWEAAMEFKADWVLITSWNEWHEGTEIKPSEEYGYYFLDATRKHATIFKET